MGSLPVLTIAMLFKRPELDAIRAGRITLAFRRWRRPTVKAGGTLKTPVGLLSIDRVTLEDISRISSADAARSGRDLASLLSGLERGGEGSIYRIEFHFAGPDPRIALREDVDLSENKLEEIQLKLRRLDAASEMGDWTLEILSAIQSKPRLAAVHLADQTGYAKEWLKTQVRKLKNLGLTISHQPGYELSPRGILVTRALKLAKQPDAPPQSRASRHEPGP